MTYVPESD